MLSPNFKRGIALRLMSVLLLWSCPMTARADVSASDLEFRYNDIFVNLTGFADEISRRIEYTRKHGPKGVFVGMADHIILPELPEIFAPGSDARRAYDIGYIPKPHCYREGEFGTDTKVEVVCLPRVAIPFPDATDFFDHHHGALVRLRETLLMIEKNPDIPLPASVDDMPAFVETWQRMEKIRISLDLLPPVFGEGPNIKYVFPEEIDGFSELLSRRFFEAPVPKTDFLLTHDAEWQPEDGHLPLPFPGTADAERLTQVTFTATNTGEVEVDRVSLEFSADYPLTAITPGCAPGMPLVCDLAVRDGRAEVVLAISPPDRWADSEPFWVDFDAVLEVPVQDSAPVRVEDRWSLRFRPCRDALRTKLNELSGMPGTLPEAVERLVYLSERIATLPGAPLYKGPSERSGRQETLRPSADNGYVAIPELGARLTELIRGQATDAWMRGEAPGPGNLSSLRSDLPLAPSRASCHATGQPVGVLGDLRVAWEEADRRGEDIARLADQSESAALYWKESVTKGLTSLNLPPPSDKMVETGKLAGGAMSGAFLNAFVGLIRGPAAMEAFARRANLIGASLGTLQVLEALYDLKALEDLEKEMNEAIFWMEASAYFTGVRGRYDEIAAHLREMDGAITAARADACTCADF